MKINNEKARRLAVYFFYDQKGIVDDYVVCLLDGLKEAVSEFCIVYAANTDAKGQKVFASYGQTVCCDTKWNEKAYKAGLDKVGIDKARSFEEIIFLDSTIMGPVFPLKDTFEKMSEKETDFWSVAKHFAVPDDQRETGRRRQNDFLDPAFLVCRRTLTESAEFAKYWEHLEGVQQKKSAFTECFAARGYHFDTSADLEDLRGFSEDPLRMCPKKMIAQKGCPVFSLKCFTSQPSVFLRNTTGEQSSELYQYLKEYTEYDENLLWDKILREENQYDVVKNLNLVYPLSRTMQSGEVQVKKQKIVLVMHLYFEDLLEESRHYASAMPRGCDLYITTNSEKKKAAIEQKFQGLECDKMEVRVIENRGRDVSSLLTGVKDVIMDYDLACFVHDKKTTQLKPGTVGASFGRKCLENTLSGRIYVENIIQTFQENPRLGILSPPEPNHSVYFATIGEEWGPNYDVTADLAKRLGLKVPVSKEKPPVCPMGTMFWFRPKAMEPLYREDWEYSDYPPEPNKADGTLLHAVERIYPFVVQQSGYYPGIVMTDEYMAVEYSNLRYYTREYNKIMLNMGIGPYQDEMCEELDQRLTRFLSIGHLLKMLAGRILRRIFR